MNSAACARSATSSWRSIGCSQPEHGRVASFCAPRCFCAPHVGAGLSGGDLLRPVMVRAAQRGSGAGGVPPPAASLLCPALPACALLGVARHPRRIGTALSLGAGGERRDAAALVPVGAARRLSPGLRPVAGAPADGGRAPGAAA